MKIIQVTMCMGYYSVHVPHSHRLSSKTYITNWVKSSLVLVMLDYPFPDAMFAWMTLIVDWRRKTHQVDKKQSPSDRTPTFPSLFTATQYTTIIRENQDSNRNHYFKTYLVKFHVHKIHRIAFSLHK